MDTQIESMHVPEFSKNWALFMDVDGTLIDFAPRPDQVSVSKELVDILESLKVQTGGAVALVSGRPIQDLDKLFDPVSFSMAGQHGLERRDVNGDVYLHPMPDGDFSMVKSSIKEFADNRKNLFVEDKQHSIAIHYRQAQEHKLELEDLLDTCMQKIGMNFHLQSGKMVYEIKPHGKDKGTAIREFMLERPFKGRLPVFIGDDVTDEDGFDVVNHLGGHTIKVGEGNTLAKWRLSHSSDVLLWLKSYLNYLKK